MKTLLLMAFTSLFSLLAYTQKIIDEPKFSATTASYVKIKRIVLYDTVTVMDFLVESKPGSWIRVHQSETYIQDSKGGEQLFVKRADGIALNEQHKTPESGINSYTLYFPPIDRSVETIDYMEKQWKILDIELTPRPRAYFSIIPEAIRGNWLRNDGSNDWVYGFHDNLVIYGNEIWDKVLINNRGKNYLVNIQNSDKTQTIYLKVAKKGNLLIGPSPDKLELFSRQTTQHPDFTLPDDTEFQIPIFKLDTAVYKGFLRGYHPKLGSTGMAYVNDIITHEQNSHLITIHQDGTFYAEWPMIHPQEVFIRLLGISETVYCEPGTTTFQYINLSEYLSSTGNDPEKDRQEPTSLFMGETARINQDLQSMGSIGNFNYNRLQNRVLDMSAEEYKTYCLDEYKRKESALQEFLKENRISKKAVQIKKYKVSYRSSVYILSYQIYKRSAYRKKYNIPREQREIPLEFESLEPEYYDFINSNDLNNPVSLICSDYNVLINRIRFAEIIRPKTSSLYQSLLEYIEQNDLDISAREKHVIEKLISCETNDCIRTIMREDSATWNSFYNKNRDLFASISDYSFKIKQKENLKKYFGLSNGLALDIIFAQSICARMRGTQKPFPDEEEEVIRTEIADNFIIDYLLLQNQLKKDEIARNLEKNKLKSGYIINETPQTEADKIFDTIIRKYSGKVVFVDFWATWCGPCRSGMERIKPLKEKLSGRDIEFVYITNHTSPVDTWNMMVPDIKGEHYRIEPDEWNLMASRFNISGIPHYLLVDKTGNVVKDHVYFASSNQELEKLFIEYLNK